MKFRDGGHRTSLVRKCGGRHGCSWRETKDYGVFGENKWMCLVSL